VAVRHNTCPNPALSVNATGWSGSAVPTRAAVSGFLRPWAARYVPVSFIETPRAAVAPGLVWTLSLYAQLNSAFATVSISSYIAWYNASGGSIQFDTLSLPQLANGVTTRLVRTGTAPALAATASLIFDGTGSLHNWIDFTAMLVEQTDGANPYADGDSDGWEWDGTSGLSSSSESQVDAGLPGRIGGLTSAPGSVVAAASRSLIGAIQ
jgi:hypothetical protein